MADTEYGANDSLMTVKCIVSVGRSGSKWMEHICKELDPRRSIVDLCVWFGSTVLHLTD
ncbi:MAG: hypothetical protein ACLUV8_14125 [Clostridium sp.]